MVDDDRRRARDARRGVGDARRGVRRARRDARARRRRALRRRVRETRYRALARAKVEPRKGPGSAPRLVARCRARASAYQAAAFAHLGLSAPPRRARARSVSARALALCPADPTSGPVAFANALNANDIREATKICREALDVDSRCAWAANRLAPMRARAGDHEGAARALQVVLRVSPRNAGAWEALGASYTVLGRHSAALKAFERALELSEDSGDGAARSAPPRRRDTFN